MYIHVQDWQATSSHRVHVPFLASALIVTPFFIHNFMHFCEIVLGEKFLVHCNHNQYFVMENVTNIFNA